MLLKFDNVLFNEYTYSVLCCSSFNSDAGLLNCSSYMLLKYRSRLLFQNPETTNLLIRTRENARYFDIKRPARSIMLFSWSHSSILSSLTSSTYRLCCRNKVILIFNPLYISESFLLLIHWFPLVVISIIVIKHAALRILSLISFTIVGLCRPCQPQRSREHCYSSCQIRPGQACSDPKSPSQTPPWSIC